MGLGESLTLYHQAHNLVEMRETETETDRQTDRQTEREIHNVMLGFHFTVSVLGMKLQMYYW